MCFTPLVLVQYITVTLTVAAILIFSDRTHVRVLLSKYLERETPLDQTGGILFPANKLRNIFYRSNSFLSVLPYPWIEPPLSDSFLVGRGDARNKNNTFA